MRKSKFTESQIMVALKQTEAGMVVNEMSHLRELEEENRRLKQMYADLSLRAHGMEVLLTQKVLSLNQKREAVTHLVEAEALPALPVSWSGCRAAVGLTALEQKTMAR